MFSSCSIQIESCFLFLTDDFLFISTFFGLCLSFSFDAYRSSSSSSLDSRFVGESSSCSISFSHDMFLSSSDWF